MERLAFCAYTNCPEIREGQTNSFWRLQIAFHSAKKNRTHNSIGQALSDFNTKNDLELHTHTHKHVYTEMNHCIGREN